MSFLSVKGHDYLCTDNGCNVIFCITELLSESEVNLVYINAALHFMRRTE